MRRALLFLVFAIAAAVGANEIQVRRFMSPDDKSVIAEIEYMTGYALSEKVEVLAASRSRPSPLLGDHHSCVLLQLDADEVEQFLSRFSLERRGKYLGPCRVPSGFVNEGEYFHDRQRQPDESVAFYSNKPRQQILLEIIVR